MNPYEHAQQPAMPEPPSGLPIAGAPPPAYYPNQGYAPPGSYEHAQPIAYDYVQAPAYGYEQTYQQAAPPVYQQPPSGPPTYIITPGAPGTVVKKSGAGQKLALIALVALVVLAGGGAFAADAWAKGQVCDAVQGLGDDTGTNSGKSSGKKGSSDEPTVAELDAAEKGLNSRADLLFFHGELKEATHDLADDVDTLKTMVAKGTLDDSDAKNVTHLLALAGSLDSHARKAQRACGLPEKSLLGATA